LSALIIVNPISGTGGRPDVVRARVEQARAMLAAARLAGDVRITERAGHARQLAQEAVAAGVSTVVAWGGDGTINEVASAAAFQNVALGIVPSGSGNGLARELGIPFKAARALAIALGTVERSIDCGEVDGHLFFNVAGMGLDARVSHRFTEPDLERRGLLGYIEVTARELFRGKPEEHTVVADGTTITQRTLILAIANSRQYGNGAIIAPRARLDDGALDVVIVSDRPAPLALLQAPLLFMGAAAFVPGVTMLRASRIQISSAKPVMYHVDGEPLRGGTTVNVRVHASALRVRVPS